MLKAIQGIFNFLFHVSKMRDKAKRIKEDEEKRQTSIRFGITSILYSLVATGLCFLGAWLFISFMDSGLVLFTIILGIGLMLSGVVLFFWALVAMILQFTINKKWIGWLALLIFIAGIVASVILVLVQLGK